MTDADRATRAKNVALAILGAVSAALLALRLYAAVTIGFGDSEALYACWAAHPQPAYLDHPGLVGLVARAIGEGAIPSVARTHVVTAIAATLVPWIVHAAARGLGAAARPALVSAIVVALVPEISVGLFALTPDLLLAPMWLGALGLAGLGLRLPARSDGAAAALLAAGLLAGASGAAKVSGLLLVAALAAAYAVIAQSKRPEAVNARSIWPWAGIAAGLVVLVPIALFEAKQGWPMLRHRLVDTQGGAGLALRNAGALVGGQLAYVSPVLFVAAFFVARDLLRERARDATTMLLFLAFAVPLVPLALLSVWSPVAEPHWIAPALLALPLHAARRAREAAILSRRFVVAGASVAGALTLAVYGWVLVPDSGRLLPADTDPKVDIASELYGWKTTLEAVHEQMTAAATPFDPEGREVVVVGPHWTVCAQLHAGLPGVRVGCATPVTDDFDGWLPRDRWRDAENVLFVTDNRFGGDGAEQLPAHVPIGQSRVRIYRGGRVARVFSLFLYGRRTTGSLGGSDLWLHRREPGVADEREVVLFAGVRRGE